MHNYYYLLPIYYCLLIIVAVKLIIVAIKIVMIENVKHKIVHVHDFSMQRFQMMPKYSNALLQ